MYSVLSLGLGNDKDNDDEPQWTLTIVTGTTLALLLTFLFILVLLNKAGVGGSRKTAHTAIPVRTMLILGSGGHTKEMLSLSESLPANLYSPRIYVHSTSDELSSIKAKALEENVKMSTDSDYKILSIPRARHVGQSWISSIFTTLYSMYKSLHVFYMSHPKLILCNGPGVCIPICLIAYFFKITRIYDSKIVYVESLCRVKSLSLSGRIAKHIVDKFLIQSEELAKLNPDAVYVGRIT